MNLNEKLRAWSAEYGMQFSRQETELGTRLSVFWPADQWKYGVMQYVVDIPSEFREEVEANVYGQMVHDLVKKIDEAKERA